MYSYSGFLFKISFADKRIDNLLKALFHSFLIRLNHYVRMSGLVKRV